jgi:hypothetical protein
MKNKKLLTLKIRKGVIYVCVIIAFTLFLGSPLSFHVPVSRYTFCKGDLHCRGMCNSWIDAPASCKNLPVEKTTYAPTACLNSVVRVFISLKVLFLVMFSSQSGFEVFTLVSMKVAVFCVIASCFLVGVYQRFRGACCFHYRDSWGPNGRGGKHLRNRSKLLQDYMMHQPRRQPSSSFLSIHEISFCLLLCA